MTGGRERTGGGNAEVGRVLSRGAPTVRRMKRFRSRIFILRTMGCSIFFSMHWSEGRAAEALVIPFHCTDAGDGGVNFWGGAGIGQVAGF